MEIFKDVPGYEGLYCVSSMGRVLSLRKEGFLRPIVSKRFGYHVVTLCNKGHSKIHRVHRLVLRTFRGDSDLFANHINFDRSDNRLANLEYVTAQENTRHAIAAGRHPSFKRKLTASQVRAIRSSKEHPNILARRYDMSAPNIYSVIARRTYKDVE